MECKFMPLPFPRNPTCGINRYIMECKLYWRGERCANCTELIDTLWNVNASDRQERCKYKDELIDTLWNVNLFPWSQDGYVQS